MNRVIKHTGSHTVTVFLDDEELAAVKGWAAANNMVSVSDAACELVRIGLLSQIAETYRRVAATDDTNEPSPIEP